MPKKDEKMSSEKEIKHLWWEYLKWEYLKRSDKYKEFCKEGSERGRDYLGDYYWPFFNYLRLFGNVFEQSFEEWWNGPLRKRWRSLGSRPVLDLNDHNSYHGVYFKALVGLKKEIQKEMFPSPKKIWEIIKSEPHYIFLAVPIVGQEDMASIAEQIKKIRDGYKITAAVREADKELRRYTMPSTRIRYEELERYLDVYDFRNQGLKMPEVMKAIAQKNNVNVTANEREFFRYQSKAKKIIENVEKGYFPGKY